MKIILNFPIVPLAKQSVKYSGRNKTFYQPEKYKKYSNAIIIMALGQMPAGFKIFSGMLRVNYLIYKFRMPLKLAGKIDESETNYKPGKPDLTDNLNKPLFDALSNIIYKNDSQIVEINIMRKVYAIQEGIEMEIEEIRESKYDCQLCDEKSGFIKDEKKQKRGRRQIKTRGIK